MQAILKLIELYRTSTRPTIEQQFESSAIVSRFITQKNSAQFNLSLQLSLISSTFSFSDFFFSTHHPQQQSQVCQLTVHFKCTSILQPFQIFQILGFHGCNFFSSPCSDSDMDGFSFLIHCKCIFGVVFEQCS